MDQRIVTHICRRDRVPREDVGIVHPAGRVDEEDVFIAEGMSSSDDVRISIRIVVRVWTVRLRPPPRSEHEDWLRSVHDTNTFHEVQVGLRKARLGHVPGRVIRASLCGQRRGDKLSRSRHGSSSDTFAFAATAAYTHRCFSGQCTRALCAS